MNNLDLFTYIPSWSTPLTTTPRILTAQFGDGYAQRVPDGLNTQPATYAVRFQKRTLADAQAIQAFIMAHIAIPFLWTPPAPNDAQLQFVVNDKPAPTFVWEAFNSYTVTATFTQDFTP